MSLLRLPEPGEQLIAILKLPGETCNINCYYCYEKRKPYPDARFLEPETLSRFLDLCNGRGLAVVLHGGEPLIVGEERLKGLLDVLRAYDGDLTLGIQTNGLLLTEKMVDFLDAEWPELELTISLDGDEQASAYRVDYADRPTFNRVVEAVTMLGERGRHIGMITVVSRLLLGRARETVEHALSFKAVRALKFAPCLDFNSKTKTFKGPTQKNLSLLNPDGVGIPGWGTTPKEYAEFLMDAWNAWRDLGAYERFLIEPLASLVRTTAGLETSFTHYSDRKDPYIVTLYPDGRLGSSDEFEMPTGHLGHIDQIDSLDDVLAFQFNPLLRARLEDLMNTCESCSYWSSCRGGSLADRRRYAGTDWQAQYCESRKAIVDYISASISKELAHASADG